MDGMDQGVAFTPADIIHKISYYWSVKFLNQLGKQCFSGQCQGGRKNQDKKSYRQVPGEVLFTVGENEATV